MQYKTGCSAVAVRNCRTLKGTRLMYSMCDRQESLNHLHFQRLLTVTCLCVLLISTTVSKEYLNRPVQLTQRMQVGSILLMREKIFTILPSLSPYSCFHHSDIITINRFVTTINSMDRPFLNRILRTAACCIIVLINHCLTAFLSICGSCHKCVYVTPCHCYGQ